MMLMACQESIEEMHCDFHFGLCVNSETMFFLDALCVNWQNMCCVQGCSNKN